MEVSVRVQAVIVNIETGVIEQVITAVGPVPDFRPVALEKGALDVLREAVAAALEEREDG